MSDIFHEVDDDIRRERYKRLWDRFGLWAIGFLVLVVLATSAWRIWLYYEERAARQAGDVFLSALQIAAAGDGDTLPARLGELEDAPPGYRLLAGFLAAASLGEAGDRAGAARAYEAIAENDAVLPAYRDMARLSAAYSLLHEGGYAQALEQARRINAPGRPFHGLAREAEAMAAWKLGRIDDAREIADALALGADYDFALRGRAVRLRAVLDAMLAAQGGSAPSTGGGTAGDAP